MPNSLPTILASAALAALMIPSGLGAQEWTRFRGPNGTGMSSAKTIPVQWTDGDVAWKVPLPGSGHSSPVIWGGKLFLTSTRSDQTGLMLICLSTRDGSTQWTKQYEFAPHSLHKFNSFAASSPVVDAERVYHYWATPGSQTLMALTHEGEEVWRRELGPWESQHGGGTSPMLYEGMVIMPNEQMGKSSIAAFDAKTGEPVWSTPR